MIRKNWKKTEMQTEPEEDRKKDEWKISNGDNSTSTLLMFPFIVFLSVVFLLLMGGILTIQWRETEMKDLPDRTDTAEIAQVSCSNIEQADGQNETADNTAYTEVRDWTSQIFGSANPVSVTGKITIAGLSEQEKTRLNFIESDFTKDIGSFLNQQGIITSLVYFEEETSCSADQARSYVASMSGISNQNLQVIFYPDYPGEYIFLLTEKQKVLIRNTDTSQNSNSSSAGQMNNQSNHQNNSNQQVQNYSLQSDSLQNAQQQNQGQSGLLNQETEKATTQNTYDASILNIYAVPEELQNYIGNQYLLQYALYDHLYQRGYYQVRSATVISYSIDGDNRSASILFVLDNGKSVNAVYSLESGGYQFS